MLKLKNLSLLALSLTLSLSTLNSASANDGDLRDQIDKHHGRSLKAARDLAKARAHYERAVVRGSSFDELQALRNKMSVHAGNKSRADQWAKGKTRLYRDAAGIQ